MTKILIETGSESHTSSYANVQAKFVGGPFDGQPIYQQRQLQVRANWDAGNDKHSKWVTTEFNLPDGTQFAVIGKGATGSRGADKWNFNRIYRVDSSAEVQEIEVSVGLRDAVLKGRLVLVRDVFASKEESAKIDSEGGF